jgi:hypothetical protein
MVLLPVLAAFYRLRAPVRCSLPGVLLRRVQEPSTLRVHGYVAASCDGCADSMVRSSGPTAAGQCRDGVPRSQRRDHALSECFLVRATEPPRVRGSRR